MHVPRSRRSSDASIPGSPFMTQSSQTVVRPLQEGSRVALVAPAGVIRDASHIQQAVDNARSLGWEPVVGAHVESLHGYFAGTDAERLSDINTALRDESIDGIWCVRGGY